MKTLLIISILFSNTLFSSYFDKPYVGILGSYGYFLEKSDLNQVVNDSPTYSYTTKNKYYNGGPHYSFGGLVGIGKIYCSKYYLGLQSNFVWPGNSVGYKIKINSGNNASNKLYQKFAVDLCLHAGVLLDSCNLVYVLLGPAVSRFKFNKNNDIQESVYNTVSYNETFCRLGGRFGIGFVHAFLENWAIRLETSFSFYNQWKSNTYNFIRQSGNGSEYTSATAKLADLTLSLCYGF